jgi:hypothetical protein
MLIKVREAARQPTVKPVIRNPPMCLDPGERRVRHLQPAVAAAR